MPLIDRIWLATLTRNKSNAGSDTSGLNLIVNSDGVDIFDGTLPFLRESGGNLGPDTGLLARAQAGLSDRKLDSPIEIGGLTNSSIRVGIRTDDAWGPEQLLVFGQSERSLLPLGMETDLKEWLSTQSSEGKLSVPVRLVGAGSSTTLIQRVMFLMSTGSGDSETDNAITFQIAVNGALVLDETIGNTDQNDLEAYSANWHIRNALPPFTRGDLIANGKIELSIQGDDLWRPTSLFVFGLDTPDGRPNEVVLLVSIPEWTFRALSTDTSEGDESKILPIMS